MAAMAPSTCSCSRWVEGGGLGPRAFQMLKARRALQSIRGWEAGRSTKPGMGPTASAGAHASASCVSCPTSQKQGHEDLRQDERVMQLFGLVGVGRSWAGLATCVHPWEHLRSHALGPQCHSTAAFSLLPLQPIVSSNRSYPLPSIHPSSPGQQHAVGRPHHRGARPVHCTLRCHSAVAQLRPHRMVRGR